MTAHDEQTLLAIKVLADLTSNGSGQLFDLAIVAAGAGLFGEAWSPVKRGAVTDYAPLVSMSLGRLARRGLVEHDLRHSHEGLQSYWSWRLTDAGVELAERMLGE